MAPTCHLVHITTYEKCVLKNFFFTETPLPSPVHTILWFFRILTIRTNLQKFLHIGRKGGHRPKIFCDFSSELLSLLLCFFWAPNYKNSWSYVNVHAVHEKSHVLFRKFQCATKFFWSFFLLSQKHKKNLLPSFWLCVRWKWMPKRDSLLMSGNSQKNEHQHFSKKKKFYFFVF